MESKADTGAQDQPPAYTQVDGMPPTDEYEPQAETSKRPTAGGLGAPPAYKPPTFTTDGLNITFLNSNTEAGLAQYRLTRNLFEGRPGFTVGIERLLYTQPQVGTDIERVDVKQLYEITSNTATGLPKHNYRELYSGHETGEDTHRYSAHGPWGLLEKDAQHHVLESLPRTGLRRFHFTRHRGDPSRQIQWADQNGIIIAIEHRPGFSKAKTLELQPTMDILVELEESQIGLILAMWVARMRQEAIYLHRGHLTTQEINQRIKLSSEALPSSSSLDV